MSQKHYASFLSCKCAAYRLHNKTGKTVYIIETFWGYAAVTELEQFNTVVYTVGALKEA